MARKLSANLTRIVVGVVVLAVVLGVGGYLIFGGSSSKKVTAHFVQAVGIYDGTPVQILGVTVGKVTKVTPQGDSVKVDMTYDDKYKVPANAVAVVVSSSLVSDRFIQLAPAYSGSGPVMASGASIPASRTAYPAELDDIYAALDKLATTLGPNGANKNGSLSTLLKVAAANLQGNGAAIGNSITQLSKAAQTLANGRTDLFGTVKNLQAFTAALQSSDAKVRHFEEQLAQVASDLASERADLGAALHNLTIALNQVSTFVHDNADRFHQDIVGLEAVTGVLVKQKASLNEALAVAPIALANIVHAYQPDLGVIATRSNLASLTDPAQLCGLLQAGGLLTTVGNLLGPLTGQITKTCQALLSKVGGASTPKGVSSDALKQVIQQMLTGSSLGNLGGLVGAGG
jgi:phospholipid/cholesterol/gamma-HCH transport system substrate-binding protein